MSNTAELNDMDIETLGMIRRWASEGYEAYQAGDRQGLALAWNAVYGLLDSRARHPVVVAEVNRVGSDLAGLLRG
jgi:hypothetical protein